MKNYICGCCGVYFSSTDDIQKYYEQDTDFGICKECGKMPEYKNLWEYYMIRNSKAETIKDKMSAFNSWLEEK